MLAGMRPELLSDHLISLSNDTLAVVDVAEKGKGNLGMLPVIRYPKITTGLMNSRLAYQQGLRTTIGWLTAVTESVIPDDASLFTPCWIFVHLRRAL